MVPFSPAVKGFVPEIDSRALYVFLTVCSSNCFLILEPATGFFANIMIPDVSISNLCTDSIVWHPVSEVSHSNNDILQFSPGTEGIPDGLEAAMMSSSSYSTDGLP